MNQVTFISALFDIDRVDGRKWDQYLKWFDMTLKLKVPMLLFITDDLQEFVDERRGDLPTKSIHIKEDDIPYYCLLYTSPSPRDVEESRMPSSA